MIVFLAVMVLGFSSRTLFGQLKLLLVPRLGIILTLVVLCIVFSISVLDYFEITPGAQTVLLPMVILTMLVERFYVTTEEDSFSYAVQLLHRNAGNGLCRLRPAAMEDGGATLLVYPELHCFTVIALILSAATRAIAGRSYGDSATSASRQLNSSAGPLWRSGENGKLDERL